MVMKSQGDYKLVMDAISDTVGKDNSRQLDPINELSSSFDKDEEAILLHCVLPVVARLLSPSRYPQPHPPPSLCRVTCYSGRRVQPVRYLFRMFYVCIFVFFGGSSDLLGTDHHFPLSPPRTPPSYALHRRKQSLLSFPRHS